MVLKAIMLVDKVIHHPGPILEAELLSHDVPVETAIAPLLLSLVTAMFYKPILSHIRSGTVDNFQRWTWGGGGGGGSGSKDVEK